MSFLIVAYAAPIPAGFEPLLLRCNMLLAKQLAL